MTNDLTLLTKVTAQHVLRTYTAIQAGQRMTRRSPRCLLHQGTKTSELHVVVTHSITSRTDL
jgi:hypothetical protein